MSQLSQQHVSSRRAKMRGSCVGALSLILGLAPILAGCATTTAPGGASAEPIRAESPATNVELALNSAAKLICSDHFIAGRSLEHIIDVTVASTSRGPLYSPNLPNEPIPYTPEVLIEAARGAVIDESAGTVQVRSGPYVGRARYYEDQGCVMLNPWQEDAYFEPVTVPRVEPNDNFFPAGGALLNSDTPLPEGYDRAALEAAVAEAFKPESRTAAFLVMHRGALVLERYADGVDEETPLLNWSMGKSLLITLIGRLEQMGRISLDDPAPIDLWQATENDPRRPITVRNLMQMASGLDCGNGTAMWERRTAINAHNLIYFSPVNVVQHAITSPYLRPAGQTWKYSNCDMQSLGYILRDIVSEQGEDAYHTFPYVELYNRLGMSNMVSELDTYGNFHLTGFDYGTARDWARYGTLYLNGGVWNGERLLSEEFIEAVSLPGSAWQDANGNVRPSEFYYGGGHWLNGGRSFELPLDMMYAYGFSSNYTFIVPSEDLVIVLLHFTSLEAETSDTNAVLRPLTRGLGITVPAPRNAQ